LNYRDLLAKTEELDRRIPLARKAEANRVVEQRSEVESEGVIIANIINLWNAFGKPVCVKNA
jgi:hypothetical protein